MAKINLVVIGSSTGGPKALLKVFNELPRLNAAVVIVQHMPAYINDSLAKSIGRKTDNDVVVAEDGVTLEPGVVYVAPSEVHMKLNGAVVALEAGEQVNFVCPAVDITMFSVNKTQFLSVVGILMTGMGSDGAEGMKYLKEIFAKTVVQELTSCTIPGMPGSALKIMEPDELLSPEGIHDYLQGKFS